MKELLKNQEVVDIPKTISPALRDIKPQSKIALTEAKDFLRSTLSNTEQPYRNYFDSSLAKGDSMCNYLKQPETIPDNYSKHIPSEKLVDWSDAPGNSLAIPKADTAEGRRVKDMLSSFGQKGIEYINEYADFSPCAIETVGIDNFTENRYKNFNQARTIIAERWNNEKREGRTDWDAREVEKYCRSNKLTLHERPDMKTLDLIPIEIHQYFSHTGGHSLYLHLHPDAEKIKAKQTEAVTENATNKIAGGKFDD